MGAWGGQPGEHTFRELMQDGTFSVAMIEGYSYCPGDKWCFKSVQQYYPFLDWARAGGYLNRTVFCFGMMIGQSPLNPHGWTPQSLRTEMVALKKHYPELAGVLMYVPTQQVLVLLPFISQSSETGISGVEQVRAAPKQRVRELDKSVNAADRNGDVVADTSG
jgi:hypothetical protein